MPPASNKLCLASHPGTPPKTRPSPVINVGSLAALVGAGLALAYLQIPGKEELALRLLKDGQIQRAAAAMAKPVGSASASTPPTAAPSEATAHLLEASIGRHLRQEGKLADVSQFQALVDGGTDPALIAQILEGHRSELRPERFARFLELLGDKALAQSNHLLAADLYRRSNESLPSAETVLKQVAVFRAVSKPLDGLAAMDRFEHDRPSAVLPVNWTGLKITILRETEQGSRAFDLLAAMVRAGGDETDLSLLETVASEADRTADAIPLIKACLAKKESTRWLLDKDTRMNAAASPPGSVMMQHAATLATFLEWNDDEESAFFIHFKLARLGRSESISRCLALYEGLDRDLEMCDLLTSLPAGVLEAGTYHLLAQLQTRLGRVEEAKATYRDYLASQPRDGEALGELATLLAMASQFAEAHDLLKRAVVEVPANRSLQHELGDVLVSLGRPEEALPIYEKLSLDPSDDDALERYALLAENLELPEQLAEALRREIAASPPPCVDLRLNLASTLALLPDGAHLAIASLQEGVEKFPENAPLRLKLARLLLDEQQAEGVPALLAVDSLAANAEAVELLCEAVMDGAAPAMVLEFFKAHPAAVSAAVLPEYSQFRQLLMSGDTVSLNASLASASDSKGTDDGDYYDRLRDEAEADHEHGQDAQALRKMKAWLDRSPRSHAVDWNLLGHIYKSLGDVALSRQAFERSLCDIRKTKPQPTLKAVASRSP